ncbi:MAG: hypothetical protein ACRDFX_12450, partial [Chloroflexota bacterium]
MSAGRVQEREYSVEERRTAAAAGAAITDGSFPIYTAADLEHAIALWGRSNHPRQAKAHIIKRARALDLMSRLPGGWLEKGNIGALESRRDRKLHQLNEQVELIESQVMPSPDGSDQHIVEVTLIRSGLSKMGNHYPPAVLTAAAPLFEGAPAMADHQKRPDLPEGSVRDIAGSYQNVRAVTESAGISLRAELHLLPSAVWLFELLRAAETNPRICGLSIDAWAERDDARSTRESQYISGISRVQSVDVVTRPSAGGGIRRVLQSDVAVAGGDPARTPKEKLMEHEAAIDDTIEGSAGGVMASRMGECEAAETGQDLAATVQQLYKEREVAQSELRRLREALTPDPVTASDRSADLVRLAEEIRLDRDLARAAQTLDAALGRAALPAPVEAKLRKHFGGRRFDAALLESAISEEQEVLAALTRTGEIRGMGYEKHVQVGRSDYEQLQSAFDALFDLYESDEARGLPRLSGIREAFLVATGRDISSIGGADCQLRETIAGGLTNYVRRGRLAESEVLLREADVTTASFSSLLGTSMNKRLLKDYQAWPSEWQKFTTIVAIKD